ncbi:MAG TPA: sensor histidine kinase [Symbiobacteriaceae bacterium]|nr:sensor histidine kinase [Symbiobacteriaceae bacterium]
MPTILPPGRLAAALTALTALMCDASALEQAIPTIAAERLGARNPRLITDETKALSGDVLIPLTPNVILACESDNELDSDTLTAYAAVAGRLLQQSSHCQITVSEYAAVLAKLDQVKRDLDSAHRNEWIAHERMRIAQDLHDRAAQTLFGLGLTADWLLAHADPSLSVYGDLERMKQMAATGLRQVREAIFSLSSAPVEPAHFRQAIRTLLKDVEASGIIGTMQVWGDVHRLTADVTDALYQIIREALINVRRHSQASNALVSVRIEDERVTAVVQDDGVGISEAVADTYRKNGAHLGLRGMESRAERLGGKLTLAPGDECGLILTAKIPLKGVAAHG